MPSEVDMEVTKQPHGRQEKRSNGVELQRNSEEPWSVKKNMFRKDKKISFYKLRNCTPEATVWRVGILGKKTYYLIKGITIPPISLAWFKMNQPS